MSARINHPNVAKTFDFLALNGTNYLIEQLIEGSDLKSRMQREFDRLDPHLAAHVIHHVVKGVAASHRVGVFHRDLKPSNIMVSDDPGLTLIKVTDFGIAKMAEAEIGESVAGGDDSISSSATVVGALPYMAPELIQPGMSPGLPADIWALGAMLYYFLVGKPPFGTGLIAVNAIINGALPRLEDAITEGEHFAPLISALSEIIAECMQRDASKRPTADELCERLAKLPYSTALRKLGVINSYGSGTGSWGFISGDDGSDCFFSFEQLLRPKAEVRRSCQFFPISGKTSAASISGLANQRHSACLASEATASLAPLMPCKFNERGRYGLATQESNRCLGRSDAPGVK